MREHNTESSPKKVRHDAYRGPGQSPGALESHAAADGDASAHQRRLRFVMDSLAALIAYVDAEQRFRLVNLACETWFGRSRNEIIGKSVSELMGAAYADMVPFIASALRGERVSHEHVIPTAAGERHAVLAYTPDVAADASVRGFSLTIDIVIAERRKLERDHDALLARERTARIQAETAARARDEFLAIVSHELRAPLNGIQSWAHVLENHVRDAAPSQLAQRALNGIKIGVAQQVRLIEDLLDVTRMMSGRLRLTRQPISVLPVIQAAVESVRDIAAAKHITIACTYRITTEKIDGDSDRVQQVIWNLLSNAIKFTPEDGNIWLSAVCAGGQVIVTIRDNGLGISAEFLPHLFDRFSQEDTSSTRRHSGLGLGLFLVRYLVELHGGSVRVDSAGEGKGATFSVFLPSRTSRDRYLPVVQCEPGDIAGPLPSLNGLRILLIDDQEEARESLGAVLAGAGASVFSAASVNEVFAWLGGLANNDMPDILVCDIAMPVEDGYSVLRKLRAWDCGGGIRPLHRLPALALTAFAQREDRIRALTAGFQMHLTKPVAPEELIVVIAMMATRG